MNYSQTSFFDRSQTLENAYFWRKIQDIVAKIHITPEEIVHLDYEPATIPKYHQEYLKQVYSDRYLTDKLTKYLYDICSNNIRPKQDSVFNRVSNLDTQQPFTNYASKWSETKFYRQLIQHNHSSGYEDPNWLVVKQEAQFWRITKDGLTLKIEPQQHLVGNLQLQIGQMVSVKMPPNLVERGFYIAIGEAGSISMSDRTSAALRDRALDNVIELYFNVRSLGALLLLDSFTRQANPLKIPFNFKIAYNENCDRFDAVVLELKSSDFIELRPILKNIHQENRAYFQPEIPFFCKAIASGIGLAQKPNRASTEPENMGQHLCGIIAKAMMDWQKEKSDSATKRLDYVFNSISTAGVNFKHLYLNPNAKDIYEAL